MSKLDDYKNLLQHLKTSPIRYNRSDSYFSSGFGKFSELLLNDDKNTWASSNHKYYEVVQDIKEAFKSNGRMSELEELKNSLLTSFYTPSSLCSTIVNSLPIELDTPINVLEPAAGTGNFINPLIDRFSRINITTIEKDATAAGILKSTFNTEAIHSGFEAFDTERRYDLIISNIPFGDFKVFNKEYANGSDEIKKRSLNKNQVRNYRQVINLSISTIPRERPLN